MEKYDEMPPQTPCAQPKGFFNRFSKSIKIVVIGFLVLLMLIPMFMIRDLISERDRTQELAISEVSNKWSRPLSPNTLCHTRQGK